MNNALNHWACIHDSFGVHAAADLLHVCIRETFVEQYTPTCCLSAMKRLRYVKKLL